MRMMAAGSRAVVISADETNGKSSLHKKNGAAIDTLVFSKDGYVAREVPADTSMSVALQPEGIPDNQAYNKLGIYPGFFNHLNPILRFKRFCSNKCGCVF